MNILGPLSNLFPLLHWLLILSAGLRFFQQPHPESFVLLLAVIYLLPPALFRLYSLKYPPREDRWTLDPKVRNDWWIYFQLQMVYANAPVFESILRAVPFAYSAWLRLWGSKVGKRVYWTPNVQILDRHMLRIGDDVVFGHQAMCSAHLVTRRKDGRLVLILRRIEIGSNCLIGGETRIGPGVCIPPGTLLPYRSEVRFRYEKQT